MDVQATLHVTALNQAQPAAKQAKSASQDSGAQADPAGLTVSLSGQGKSMSAMQAAAQEASETQAQTAKEAAGGDLQAKKLLAKEEAAQAGANPGGGGLLNKMV